MKSHFLVLMICWVTGLAATTVRAQEIPTVYVDSEGVMRWSDTHGEVSLFGVNYTLPFAHAYRAMGYLGVNRKEAIDRDVYHLARLGIDAYRIHIWDVEISDSQGNLLENEHLDLLDYLFYKLRERGIRILVTAQTNFGNGYPEHDLPTDGYSYHQEKCSVHQAPESVKAQERYLAALVRHVNPYTNLSYKDDPYIVGFEINNEPCHTGTVDETQAYIERMLSTIRRAGCRKPVFYNVSHNGQVVEAYYRTDIQGTTYQWYPTGLVAGHTRLGNFLPSVEQYPIPFSEINGFGQKARLVYEFDPADILYTYMYPATVRTLRSAGFQWITQFAYDPIDMAAFNTEYQTHYLNAAYTPGKAVGLMIAAEAARRVKRGERFPDYPTDTLFADIRVSHIQDLSELNDGECFYYSNHTTTQPKNAALLRAIAGCGSSPVVKYEGTGLYWIDRLEEGVWRLEVMPDVVQCSDPFAKPSLQKKVMQTIDGTWDMTLSLPDLGTAFTIRGLDAGNARKENISDGTIPALHPGVYLLQRNGSHPASEWDADTPWKNIKLGEYVKPTLQFHADDGYIVRHTPPGTVDAGSAQQLSAVIAGVGQPDSVVLYTDKVSFWNKHNPSIRLQPAGGYRWQGTVPASDLAEGSFRYNLVVFSGGKSRTYPQGVDGNPLDWDFTATGFYEIEAVSPQAPLLLLDAEKDRNTIEIFMLPEWGEADNRIIRNTPATKPTVRLTFKTWGENPRFFVRHYVRKTVEGRLQRLKKSKVICLRLPTVPQGLQIGFITQSGYTYAADCPTPDADGLTRIPLSSFRQTDTALLPKAFPTFLPTYFHPQTSLPFRVEEVETLELSCPADSGGQAALEVGEIWLE